MVRGCVCGSGIQSFARSSHRGQQAGGGPSVVCDPRHRPSEQAATGPARVTQYGVGWGLGWGDVVHRRGVKPWHREVEDRGPSAESREQRAVTRTRKQSGGTQACALTVTQ